MVEIYGKQINPNHLEKLLPIYDGHFSSYLIQYEIKRFTTKMYFSQPQQSAPAIINQLYLSTYVYVELQKVASAGAMCSVLAAVLL